MIVPEIRGRRLNLEHHASNEKLKLNNGEPLSVLGGTTGPGLKATPFLSQPFFPFYQSNLAYHP